MQATDAQTLVLCTLAEGPLHGYAINMAIEELTGRRLGPGSLYEALAPPEQTSGDRLARNGRNRVQRGVRISPRRP